MDCQDVNRVLSLHNRAIVGLEPSQRDATPRRGALLFT